MNARVRIAVVGLGVMGSRWLRALVEHPGVDVTVVCDVDAERARRTADDVGATASTDPGEVADWQVDGVVVVTPEHLHEVPAMAAIEAGVAVAIDKPVAHDIATAERIRDAATARGVPVLAGHILRFEPRYAAIKAAVDNGDIGAVVGLRSDRIGTVSDQEVLRGRTTLPLYYGVHELDLVRWYAGDIARVAAFRSSGVLAARGYDVADLYSISLRTAGGAHGTSMLGWSLPDSTSSPGLSGFTVLGERGYLQVTQGATGLVASTGAGPVPVDTWYTPVVHGRVGGAMAHEVAHFVEVVRGDTVPLCTASDGTEALRASLAVERAATDGRVVEIAEVVA